MNTPEQIAEKWAELMYAQKPVDFDSFKECFNSAIAEATQPLHQRLIDAEVQVGKMKEVLISVNWPWCRACGANIGCASPEHEKDCLVLKALSPSPRTCEAFTAMMKALEAYRRYELLSEAAERHTEDSRDLGYENDPTGSLHVTESSEKATKQFAHFQDLASIAIQLAKEVAG